MSGMWKRSHGRTSEAPPDERGGYRYVRPTATAPHLELYAIPWRLAPAKVSLLNRLRTFARPVIARRPILRRARVAVIRTADRVDEINRWTGGRGGAGFAHR